ncbi:MAG: HU family DNA-binding protein [Thermoanaerobacterium sp.]|nr:HU family DNA-binding protein [Thermoanaerobacterium sp.]
MNKVELSKVVADKLGIQKKDSEAVVSAVFETIGEVLASGEEVNVAGFGRFGVKETKERTARNPKTGEEVKVEASKKPTFKAAKALKESVKG